MKNLPEATHTRFIVFTDISWYTSNGSNYVNHRELSANEF